ncbi:MAG: hypothetical protein M3550_00115 [Actinomycetota bacterium]|nr:hypothetical protein [Actinomycetota bacterium]
MLAEDDREDHADEETLPDTPLHAYKEGREDDVEGDVDKLKAGDPKESQREEISDGSEESNFPNADKA